VTYRAREASDGGVATVKTVLLVAPEGESRDHLSRALREKGCLVSVAARALSAMEVLSRLPYHLVVSSPVLPDGNGPGFLAEVRRRYPASALLLLGSDPAGTDLDVGLLLRLSRLARGEEVEGPGKGRS